MASILALLIRKNKEEHRRRLRCFGYSTPGCVFRCVFDCQIDMIPQAHNCVHAHKYIHTHTITCMLTNVYIPIKFTHTVATYVVTETYCFYKPVYPLMQSDNLVP